MAHRGWGQLGFADHLVMRHGRPNELLTRLAELTDWAALGGIVAGPHDWPHARRPTAGDGQGVAVAAVVRLVRSRARGGLVGSAVVPGVLWAAAGRRENRLDQQIFEEVNRQLDRRRLMLRKGTLVDASLVPAAVNPPKKPKEPLPPGPDGEVPSQLVKATAIRKPNGPRRAARRSSGGSS